MNYRQRAITLVQGFAPTFWIANTLELFERLAYYGASSVLTVYLADKVGLNDEAGKLAGTFTAILYLLPALAGVFVDKYGFKRTLMACFAIFCIGYALIGFAGMAYGQDIVQWVGKKPYVITVLFLTAIGGSLIKPCIVGTVAKTTKPETRALGFSIYYTLVNLGGAIGPIIAYHVRTDLGIEYVLVMSAITSFLLFLGAWIFFREPEGEPTEQKTFGKVFSDMILVFTNVKFISFLLIFSGFWMMFWHIYFLLPFYAKDILKFEAFEFLETVDAWTIILITIPVTALVSKWKSISAITVGLGLASISWIIVGAGGSITATVVGIMFFALGEAIQAPRFYEYVSAIAPKDQIGTFMGFAFLPIAVGSFTAGFISDWLRSEYMQTNPAMMWYTLSMIGLTSTVLLVLYNFLTVKK
jgi:POT family proton-dependent oligopeptide transporter